MTAMLLPLALLAASAPAAAISDYPTETRVDYVIGCMAANGQSYDSLSRCSCSIDTIASLLPYSDYEKAETVMRMRDEAGERASLFRDVKTLTNAAQRLREAQVEADLRCF